MGDVVRLIDVAAGFSPSDTAGLMEWAQNWLDAFKAGKYGEFRSMTIIVEDKDGQLATVSQGFVPMDTARMVGILQFMSHIKINGGGSISGFRVE